MKKIKRGDQCYREIEQFKDYELSNCIAYEMAIRNPEYIRKVKIFTKEIAKINNKLMEKIPAFEEKYKREKNITTVLPTDREYLRAMEMNIGKVLSEFHNKSKKEALEEFGIQYLHLNSPLGATKTVQGLTNTVQFIENKDFLRNKSELRFVRPKLDFRNMKTTEVKLNMSLPKEELIAYVDELIKQIQADLSQVITPYEYYEIEMEEVCNDPDMPKNKTSGKTIQKVLADRFFMYDRYKQIKKVHERCKRKKKFLFNQKRKLINGRDDLDKYDKKNELENLKEQFISHDYSNKSTVLDLKIRKELDLYEEERTLIEKYENNKKTHVEMWSEIIRKRKEYASDKTRDPQIERIKKWTKDMIDGLGYKKLILG